MVSIHTLSFASSKAAGSSGASSSRSVCGEAGQSSQSYDAEDPFQLGFERCIPAFIELPRPSPTTIKTKARMGNGTRAQAAQRLRGILGLLHRTNAPVKSAQATRMKPDADTPRTPENQSSSSRGRENRRPPRLAKERMVQPSGKQNVVRNSPRKSAVSHRPRRIPYDPLEKKVKDLTVMMANLSLSEQEDQPVTKPRRDRRKGRVGRGRVGGRLPDSVDLLVEEGLSSLMSSLSLRSPQMQPTEAVFVAEVEEVAVTVGPDWQEHVVHEKGATEERVVADEEGSVAFSLEGDLWGGEVHHLATFIETEDETLSSCCHSIFSTESDDEDGVHTPLAFNVQSPERALEDAVLLKSCSGAHMATLAARNCAVGIRSDWNVPSSRWFSFFLPNPLSLSMVEGHVGEVD
ncbi:hypothetical protein BDW22DRAFT_1350190 [Trametopsis cervina]|nr:hypothetical protein BDW22DRAFT_1350190 [Trametopsis cervina]